MVVVHQASQAAKNETSRNAWRSARPWSTSYKRTSMPLFATLLLATLVSSTVNSTMVLILFLSLHLLHPARNSTSPLPPLLPSPLPSPPLLLPSLNPTNHHIGGTRAKSEPSKTFEFLERQTAIDPDMDGCMPKEFDPTFQFKDIALTFPDQVHFLPIVEVPLLLALYIFCSSPSPSHSPSAHPPLRLSSHIYWPWNSVDFAHWSRSWAKSQCCLTWRSARTSCMEPDRDSVSFEEIIDAATMANIHKFISSLPNGCNTRAGRQGELAFWWAETKNCQCMYFCFSFIFFCYFWFLITISFY